MGPTVASLNLMSVWPLFHSMISMFPAFATAPTCCIRPKKSALHPHLHRPAVTDTPDDLGAKRHRLAGRGGALKVAPVFRADVHAADDLVAISDEVLDVMSDLREGRGHHPDELLVFLPVRGFGLMAVLSQVVVYLELVLAASSSACSRARAPAKMLYRP